MIDKRWKPDEATRKKVLASLRRAVGPERVSDNPGVLYSYSGTSMLFPKAVPDFVARPASTEEVKKVMGVARRYKVPLTPVASATQEPGTYPWFGGIVLDTTGMDSILSVNPEGGYAVIQPGVTILKLSTELEKHNLRCTMGSFPTHVSALGNYLMTAVNSHRSAGPLDDILGLEVVMADGSVIHTGSRAFGDVYPRTGWHSPTNGLPGVKNLFIDSCGTLGVVTAGAVRAYSLGEDRILPVTAFDDYRSALEFMLRAARMNLVQHVCCWHWVLYTIIDHLGVYGRGAPADVLVRDPWSPPHDRPYVIVAPTIAGFKEMVDAAADTVRRVAAEHGGRPWEEECRRDWPGAWKFLADHYRDHKPTNQFMGGYGEGYPVMPIVIADPKRIVELEKWGLEFLRNSELKLGLAYYSHVIDQGRSVFLRMTPFISGEADEKEKEKAARIRQQYLERAYERYGAVPIRFDYGHPPGKFMEKAGPLKKKLAEIKWALDPDNVVNPGMSINMYGRPRKKKS